MNTIIATRSDLDALATSAPAEHAAFLALLRASLTTRTDVQAYPEGYDHTLTPEAPGYLTPIYEDRPTPELAARFGFTPEQLADL